MSAADAPPDGALGGPGGAARLPSRIWAWPAVFVFVLAVAGRLQGPYGAALGGLAAFWTVVLLFGRDVVARRALLALSALCVVAAACVVYGEAVGIPQLSTEPLRPPPSVSTSTP